MSERYFGRCRHCAAWTAWNAGLAIAGSTLVCHAVETQMWLLALVSAYVFVSSSHDAYWIWHDCGLASKGRSAR